MAFICKNNLVFFDFIRILLIPLSLNKSLSLLSYFYGDLYGIFTTSPQRHSFKRSSTIGHLIWFFLTIKYHYYCLPIILESFIIIGMLYEFLQLSWRRHYYCFYFGSLIDIFVMCVCIYFRLFLCMLEYHISELFIYGFFIAFSLSVATCGFILIAMLIFTRALIYLNSYISKHFQQQCWYILFQKMLKMFSIYKGTYLNIIFKQSKSFVKVCHSKPSI